jgi:hypothetical protein
MGCSWVYSVRGCGFRRNIHLVVVKPGTIRTVLTIATSRSWATKRLDVSNVFLHGHLKEHVLCHQPRGSLTPSGLMLSASLRSLSTAYVKLHGHSSSGSPPSSSSSASLLPAPTRHCSHYAAARTSSTCCCTSMTSSSPGLPRLYSNTSSIVCVRNLL